ncbi:hypothetical protein BDN71DRAFT_1449948 [Pleurotus eryngii]|uniref:Uncharacterized protein n=1 Tax=Pleurotus eryngii TaxID=5323 RepID=A0A9P6D5P9_PLEER|nr:hypothetical protein BDN71DRAFT_1449948 [Pleurotus eryngii]
MSSWIKRYMDSEQTCTYTDWVYVWACTYTIQGVICVYIDIRVGEHLALAFTRLAGTALAAAAGGAAAVGLGNGGFDVSEHCDWWAV